MRSVRRGGFRGMVVLARARTYSRHASPASANGGLRLSDTRGRRLWRNMAEPPGCAARPEAGSSVAPVVTTGAPCVRGLGMTIAPRRRATFHQSLLCDQRVAKRGGDGPGRRFGAELVL